MAVAANTSVLGGSEPKHVPESEPEPASEPTVSSSHRPKVFIRHKIVTLDLYCQAWPQFEYLVLNGPIHRLCTGDTDRCPMCLQDWSAAGDDTTEPLRFLCEHVLCRVCARDWFKPSLSAGFGLKHTNACPLCRFKFFEHEKWDTDEYFREVGYGHEYDSDEDGTDSEDTDFDDFMPDADENGADDEDGTLGKSSTGADYIRYSGFPTGPNAIAAIDSAMLLLQKPFDLYIEIMIGGFQIGYRPEGAPWRYEIQPRLARHNGLSACAISAEEAGIARIVLCHIWYVIWIRAAQLVTNRDPSTPHIVLHPVCSAMFSNVCNELKDIERGASEPLSLPDFDRSLFLSMRKAMPPMVEDVVADMITCATDAVYLYRQMDGYCWPLQLVDKVVWLACALSTAVG